MWNLMKIGQAVSEKFKDYDILYMYLPQGKGQITPGDKIVVTKSVCYFNHTL